LSIGWLGKHLFEGHVRADFKLFFKLIEQSIIERHLYVNVFIVGDERLTLFLPDVVINLSILEAAQVVVDDKILESVREVARTDPYTA
jgi:hypothetical protein